ncbi:MAG TPA: ECF-type sigma factor [Candidatus Sulfopaludibacter sp.]|nr:ECF-type sigma factor [Candidatus Sulfopaludibacter sp.]
MQAYRSRWSRWNCAPSRRPICAANRTATPFSPPRWCTKLICVWRERATPASSIAHFLAVAARLMRQILVDPARARNTGKRSGGARVPLHDEIAVDGRHAALVMSLDEALDDLERQDPEKARILKLKYFGGMTNKDRTEALGVSVHKVNRQMRLAQAWMRRALKAQADPPPDASD